MLGTRKDVAEAGARPPDDALAAEEARQKAEADAKAKAEAKASAAPPRKERSDEATEEHAAPRMPGRKP